MWPKNLCHVWKPAVIKIYKPSCIVHAQKYLNSMSYYEFILPEKQQIQNVTHSQNKMSDHCHWCGEYLCCFCFRNGDGEAAAAGPPGSGGCGSEGRAHPQQGRAHPSERRGHPQEGRAHKRSSFIFDLGRKLRRLSLMTFVVLQLLSLMMFFAL